MAEAQSNNKDDQITCSICLERYTEPHILSNCSHTFCLQCIKQLEVNGDVQCVECRAWTGWDGIQKNHKVQQLIDEVKESEIKETEDSLVKNATSKSDADSPSAEKKSEDSSNDLLMNTCALCKKWKVIWCRCMDCSEYMCSDCITLHDRKKENETHMVKSVHEVIHMNKSIIHNAMNELITEKKNLEMKTAELGKTVQDIQLAQQEQVAMVRKATQEGIEQLKQAEKEMSEKIQETNNALMKDMEEDMKVYESTKKELRGKVNYLEEKSKCTNVHEMVEVIKHMEGAMLDEVEDLKRKLPNRSNEEMLKSTVVVTRKKDFDPRCVVDVVVDQTSDDDVKCKENTESPDAD